MRKSLISSLSFLALCFLFSETVNSATIADSFFYYSDTASIAPNKSGWNPDSGLGVSSNNFTNNSKGITGVKITFDTLGSLNLNDFDFHFGNTNITGSWDLLSLSNPSISIYSNEAIITWDSPIAKNGWLEIKYSTDQYLYFGNLVGDASLDSFLTPYDATLVINHLNSGSSYSYQYDINGDEVNTPIDALIIIDLLNSGGSGTSLADGPFVQTSSGPPSPIRLPYDPNLFPYPNITFDLTYANETYALVASPVPEPATMLLLGSGLISLAGFRRKLKK